MKVLAAGFAGYRVDGVMKGLTEWVVEEIVAEAVGGMVELFTERTGEEGTVED